MTLYQKFSAYLDDILDALGKADVIPASLNKNAITIEPPRDPSHGDLSTNAAMVLAGQAKSNPRALAGHIADHLEKLGDVDSVDIAGPGFINIRLSPQAWMDELLAIAKLGEDYGRSDLGKGKKVNVEYVSANPTGPMHMGHCRGAVVGDALASLLEFSGHDVTREFYINDAGGQVDVLARSVHLRYCEALGRDIGEIPEGLYPGDYLVATGERLAKQFGDHYLDSPEEEWLAIFRKESVADMMALIRADLALLGIYHDIFSSEAELQQAKKPEQAEADLRKRGLIYDGELEPPKGKMPDDWEAVTLPLFRSTQFGDDQDRPIKKADGSWTYFGADMAYHWQKAQNADELIDIWGADHAGTVKRITAAVKALTNDDVKFDIQLVQMVKLLRGGEPVKMSKRSGTFVTLADVVSEVGKDVVRFTMLTRKSDAQMEFDFEKVVEASKDNPVFYVNYAHARINSLLNKAKLEGITPSADHISRLSDDEWAVMALAAQFPRIVLAAAKAREPHRIAFYLNDLAAAFHSWFNLGNDDAQKRIIMVHDQEISSARLFLAQNIRQIIANGLGILSVTPAEKM